MYNYEIQNGIEQMQITYSIPCTLIVEELDDCLLLTVQLYSPPDLPLTLRVWMYKASTGLFRTVDVD